MNRLWKTLIIVLFVSALPGLTQGWDFSRHNIPKEEIMSGGPPRDGIPALTSPGYVAASGAGFMAPDEKVLGVAVNGEARAYPLRILSWHELVNDRIGGEPVLVSW